MSRWRAVVGLVAVVVIGAGVALAALRPWQTASEPEPLALDGDLATHDPALVVGDEGEPWFVYSTGAPGKSRGAPLVHRSDDGGTTWEAAGTAWSTDEDPQWVRDSIDGVEHFWAPELVEHDGTWYLYYSASTFGSNTSAIGLATGSTLDPEDPDYGWTHQGAVWRSQAGDPYNAIDPGVITDADGTPWLFYGSFWEGIHVLPLDWPSGMPAEDADTVQVASRPGVTHNPIEAPYVVERDGWYYLFVSWGKCCSGVSSTYSIHVGRSRDVTGPFVDADGVDMADGGGTLVLGSRDSLIGPGGQSLSEGYLGYHFYDGDNAGAHRLAIQRLGWDDGWPVATTAVP
ncbi:arabinan endo-1,5-alpha-L-arabinosidase [Isoptericola haloaureus]|uniref:Arabinan endo-1,5-alpha-L-arabinosidase n=1 Tax=Isoptericola haloaureus TaxID=1542902 RepID=A0ABU7Z8C9_9MICO